MPMINVKYDDAKVKDEEVMLLCNAVKNIVAEVTKIPEVMVYADSPKIKVGVDPIEIFIEMSASIISDREKLFQDIRNGVSAWKKSSNFQHPITITLIPMDWKFEVGI